MIQGWAWRRGCDIQNRFLSHSAEISIGQEMHPPARCWSVETKGQPELWMFVLGPFKYTHTSKLWLFTYLALREPPLRSDVFSCVTIWQENWPKAWRMISAQVSSKQRFVCLHNETNGPVVARCQYGFKVPYLLVGRQSKSLATISGPPSKHTSLAPPGGRFLEVHLTNHAVSWKEGLRWLYICRPEEPCWSLLRRKVVTRYFHCVDKLWPCRWWLDYRLVHGWAVGLLCNTSRWLE